MPHTPPTQEGVPLATEQALSQAPQLLRSSCTGMQLPPHTEYSESAQVSELQVPPMHATPPVQTMPHPPQLNVSCVRSAHVSAHSTWPDGQVQTPLRQLWSGAQGGQLHTPPTQLEPLGQALPQAPQLLAFLCKG